MTILVELMEGGKVPTKGHTDDGGWDIYTPDEIALEPGHGVSIATGIKFLLPLGWTGLVRSRSSMFKKDIITEGTIDRYTGQIGIRLFNMRRAHWVSQSYIPKDAVKNFEPGDKIAQIVPVWTGAGVTSENFTLDMMTACSTLKVVDKLPETSRGEGGFGSTGR